MPFIVPIEVARAEYPEYVFVCPLTPSEQKAAFHVRNAAGEDLCLKVINPNCRLDYLQREILALQRIRHAHVARLREYVYASKDGILKHHLVEEFIMGTDLSEGLRRNEPWPTERVSRFFSEVCDGLKAIHHENIVHRDLKPSNIRVRSDDSPVIIDLGVARHLDLPDITNTSDGAAIGTPMYFAPEQFMGTKHDISHHTDLFAIGILVYQAAVGRHPFCPADVSLREAICQSEAYKNVREFRALPRGWQILIQRLLAKERVDRPHDAALVSRVLRKLGEE